MLRQPLPFASLVVASTNDPFCDDQRAQQLARDWRADFVSVGERGHVNGDSGLGDWPQGFAWLTQLTDRAVR